MCCGWLEKRSVFTPEGSRILLERQMRDKLSAQDCSAVLSARHRTAALCFGRFDGPITLSDKYNWLSGRS